MNGGYPALALLVRNYAVDPEYLGSHENINFMTDLLGDFPKFMHGLLTKLTERQVDVRDYPVDHICYRTSTWEEYQTMQQKIMGVSTAFLENLHNGRPITKFVLKTPMIFQQYRVPVVELPAPKKLQSFPGGLEHFEMVVGDDYNAVKEKYAALWSSIDDSGIYNQPLNITFENGQTVKFHQYSLVDVLQKEGQQFTALV